MRLRRLLTLSVGATLVVGLGSVGVVARAAEPAAVAVAADTYTWKNAEIVGGGFVPSVIFTATSSSPSRSSTSLSSSPER